MRGRGMKRQSACVGAEDVQGIFARRIAHLRREKGWTRPETARRTGVSTNYVWRLETGRREPAARVIVCFAWAFGVTTDYLLGLCHVSGESRL